MLSFANQLMVKSLKTININGSFGQHLPVLVKVFYINEAYKNEAVLLKKEMEHCKLSFIL